jgi:hypothetical protein
MKIHHMWKLSQLNKDISKIDKVMIMLIFPTKKFKK